MFASSDRGSVNCLDLIVDTTGWRYVFSHKNEVLAVTDSQNISQEQAHTLQGASVGSQPAAFSRAETGQTAAKLILKLTGEDLSREGLADTPKRFSKAFEHLLNGYKISPRQAVGQGIFPSEGHGLVSVEDVEFYSLCEHHLLPFWGRATVAYFPREKILGLSKIPRLLESFARRVQVQERITQQLADALDELIKPQAILVQLEAQHLCMMMRGVEKQASTTRTHVIKNYESLDDSQRLLFGRLLGR